MLQHDQSFHLDLYPCILTPIKAKKIASGIYEMMSIAKFIAQRL